MRCGRGSQKYASGASYDGEWLDDMRHGQGTHTDENGVYHGGWAQDKEEGYGDWEGINRPDDEAAYEGAWHLGLRCGMASSSTGRLTFEGEFEMFGIWWLDEPADVSMRATSRNTRRPGHQVARWGATKAWQLGRGGARATTKILRLLWRVGAKRAPRPGHVGRREEIPVDEKSTTRHGPRAARGACAARDGTGPPSRASTGTTWQGRAQARDGGVYEGHFAANGRHGLGECVRHGAVYWGMARRQAGRGRAVGRVSR